MNSSTVFTFDCSSDPCTSVPSPSLRGIAHNRIARAAGRQQNCCHAVQPAWIREGRQLNLSYLLRLRLPGCVTVTVPSVPMVIEVASAGMVSDGCRALPSAVTTLPCESRWKLPLRV